MCVIAVVDAGVKLEADVIERMWKQNDDGAGLAFWHGRKLVVRKGLMKVADVHEAIADLNDRMYCIHFRRATSGLTDPFQTHPFFISTSSWKSRGKKVSHANACLFHNGVISGLGSAKESDTLEFTSQILAKIPDYESRVKLLQLVSGKYVLAQDRVFMMIGGFTEWKPGIRVSNTHWEWSHRTHTTYYGTESGVVTGGCTPHRIEHDKSEPKESAKEWIKRREAKREKARAEWVKAEKETQEKMRRYREERENLEYHGRAGSGAGTRHETVFSESEADAAAREENINGANGTPSSEEVLQILKNSGFYIPE